MQQRKFTSVAVNIPQCSPFAMVVTQRFKGFYIKASLPVLVIKINKD
jgi:hypothetical protein